MVLKIYNPINQLVGGPYSSGSLLGQEFDSFAGGKYSICFDNPTKYKQKVQFSIVSLCRQILAAFTLHGSLGLIQLVNRDCFTLGTSEPLDATQITIQSAIRIRNIHPLMCRSN